MGKVRNIRLLRYLRMGCRIYGTWPPDPDAPRWRVIVPQVMYWIYFVNEVSGIVAILYGIFCCFTSVSEFVKSSVEAVFMFETLFNLIYYRWRSSEFQRLIFEMVDFFVTSNPEDNIIRQNYLHQTKIVYYALATEYILGGMLYAFSPLFIDNTETPLNTVYFFVPRDECWGFRVTFALNVLLIGNAASVLFVDLLVVTLILHPATKFMLLSEALLTSKEKGTIFMKKWIKDHQEAISCANETNRVLSPLAVKSTIVVTLYMIIASLLITKNVFMFKTSKFLIVVTFAMFKFMICSWAGDLMTNNAQDIAWKLYVSPWMNASPEVRKQAVIIIQRCQKTIAIHAKGFVTAWSLKFCGQVLYTIFSAFSTFRAIIRFESK